MRKIVVAVYPGAQSLDVTGPFEVFSTAARYLDHYGRPTPYEVVVAATKRGVIRSDSGFSFLAEASLPHVRQIDTLIVAGGDGARAAADDGSFVRAVARGAARARRVCSVCTGAFVLGAAGLLDGRRVTTHWLRSGALARAFPAARVESDQVFVRDGGLYTSGGVTAGIDLALALVEEDLGRRVAMAVAKLLVVYLKRPGDQAQFSDTLAAQTATDSSLSDLVAWIAAHPKADLSVTALARRAHMSTRNFSRVFNAEVGMTPARFVERIRVEAAQQQLCEGRGSLERVADRSGFGSEETMRRAFLRSLGVPPAAYRERFSTARRMS